MTVYAREGGAWVEATPFGRSSGAWTASDDELYARDSSEWKLIHPEVGAGGLAELNPVESLAVSAGPDDNSVTIGWTNPTQTLTPTDTQVRLAELGAVWDESAGYPATSYSWSALDPQTTYVAQVRLIRRVDGVIVATSPTRNVEFTTTTAPVGPPAPDPGGSGGDTIFPIDVGIDGGGAGSGDPVGTTDGCWYEYKLEIVPLDSLSWQATGITGTFSGELDEFSYDMTALDPTRVYRLCVREACDTDSDDIADTWGDWNCSDPFPGLADWGAICGGISNSPTLVAKDVVDDAVFRFPRFCKDAEGDSLVMTEAVSGVIVGKGAGFSSFFTDSDSESGAVPVSSLTSAPFYSLMNAPIADLPTTIVAAGDWTMASRFRALSSHSGSNGRVVVVASYAAFLANFKLTESATGWTPSFTAVTDDGVKTITGDEITFDTSVTHTLAARWDDDANLELWVDGSEVGTSIDVSSIEMTTATTTGVVAAQAAGVAAMQQLGWDRALTDDELSALHGITIDPPTASDWTEWSYDGGWLEQDTAGMSFGTDTYSASHQNSFDAPGALLYTPGGESFEFPANMFAQLANATSSHSAFGVNLGSGFGVAIRVADDCSSFLAAVIREGSSGAVSDQLQIQSVVGNVVTVLANVDGLDVQPTVDLRVWAVGDTVYASCTPNGAAEQNLSASGANAFTGRNVAVVKTGSGDADSPSSSGDTFTAGSV